MDGSKLEVVICYGSAATPASKRTYAVCAANEEFSPGVYKPLYLTNNWDEAKEQGRFYSEFLCLNTHPRYLLPEQN